MRAWLAIGFLLACVGAAYAIPSAQQIIMFGGQSSATNLPQPTGDILLVDGVSLILQTDAASFICRAGGC